MEAYIINMFGFILKNNIFKWGENYIQDHPNYKFEELELEHHYNKRFPCTPSDFTGL
jgi:hypothetical protein